MSFSEKSAIERAIGLFAIGGGMLAESDRAGSRLFYSTIWVDLTSDQ